MKCKSCGVRGVWRFTGLCVNCEMAKADVLLIQIVREADEGEPEWTDEDRALLQALKIQP